MKRKYYWMKSGMLALLCVCFMSISYSQEIDYIEYARYNNPPLQANFIGHTVGGTSFVSRMVYTKDFTYHNVRTLKIESLDGETTPDKISNTIFVNYDDEHFIFVGSTFNNDTFGSIDLFLSEPTLIPRFVAVGETITQTGESRVSLGPIPAMVNVSLTVDVLGMETVVVPLGTFENAVKANIKIAVLLAGIELGSVDTTDWYHPLVGLVKQISNASGKTSELSAINPPVEITDITGWMCY
ncbi:MAG: hypothetical protein C4527_11215 [Candidatus Omnitrophota bacterium]|jgi:hypothetical protein|nr:MAG: hypothetical protein C4527_11215 [Candidatus Omnitrophota bacterium]